MASPVGEVISNMRLIVSLNAMKDLQILEFLDHSAVAHAAALPVKWEIINAILASSDTKAAGLSW